MYEFYVDGKMIPEITGMCGLDQTVPIPRPGDRLSLQLNDVTTEYVVDRIHFHLSDTHWGMVQGYVISKKIEIHLLKFDA